MKEDIYEVWQNGKMFYKGTKQELSEQMKLSLSTINNYCRPGYLEGTKNETNTKVVKSSGRKK